MELHPTGRRSSSTVIRSRRLRPSRSSFQTISVSPCSSFFRQRAGRALRRGSRYSLIFEDGLASGLLQCREFELSSAFRYRLPDGRYSAKMFVCGWIGRMGAARTSETRQHRCLQSSGRRVKLTRNDTRTPELAKQEARRFRGNGGRPFRDEIEVRRVDPVRAEDSPAYLTNGTQVLRTLCAVNKIGAR